MASDAQKLFIAVVVLFTYVVIRDFRGKQETTVQAVPQTLTDGETTQPEEVKVREKAPVQKGDDAPEAEVETEAPKPRRRRKTPAIAADGSPPAAPVAAPKAKRAAKTPRPQLAAPKLVDDKGRSCKVMVTKHCATNPNDPAKKSFEEIYEKGLWDQNVRSGTGSTMKGAFDTIMNFQQIMNELDVKSVADVPCGDLTWQLSIQRINAAHAYFGGDLTDWTIQRHRKVYEHHPNKVFEHFNVIECDVPKWYTDCDPTPRPFDFIFARDVIQHVPIASGIQALKRLVLNSGAKYVAFTSYENLQNCENDRSIQCGEAPQGVSGMYRNRMRCAPWKLPAPLKEFASHASFDVGDVDHMLVYKVDDLIPYVERIVDCSQPEAPPPTEPLPPPPAAPADDQNAPAGDNAEAPTPEPTRRRRRRRRTPESTTQDQ